MKLRSLIATVRQAQGATRPDDAAACAEVLRVEIYDTDGHRGCGETLPCGEISGETLRSALSFVEHQQAQWLRSLHDLENLRAFTHTHAQAIDWNPAAWTAVELALLDLLSRRHGRRIEDLLGLRPATLPPAGTAVIGEAAPGPFDGQLTYFICAGYRDYKVPLSGTLEVDRTRVEALEAGHIAGTQVRAAARRLWTSAEQADDYLWQLRYPWWALEEPLAPGALSEMRKLGEMRDARIVLDDSVCRVDQLDALADDPGRWLVCMRVAKIGGLMRTLRFAERARSLGLELILVTQRDDPLSLQRAHLCVGAQTEDILRTREGGLGEPDFPVEGLASRPADRDSTDQLSQWLHQPGLGVDYAG